MAIRAAEYIGYGVELLIEAPKLSVGPAMMPAAGAALGAIGERAEVNL